MPGQEETGEADWTSSIVAIFEYRYSSLIPGKYLFFNLLCLLAGNTCKTESSYLVMKSKIQFVVFLIIRISIWRTAQSGTTRKKESSNAPRSSLCSAAKCL